MSEHRDALKARLLTQARQRSRQPVQARQAQLTNSTQVPERFTRFDHLPGYQQISMMRQGASQLGLKDPFFRVHDGCAGATTSIGGQPYINFASYNYLGFSGDSRLNQAASDAVARYGTSVSASRMVSGERPVHSKLEDAIADAYGVDDAVVFVSGHATNISTLGFLLGPKDLILHDEYSHNSLLVGAQLSGAKRIPFPHNDSDALDALLSRHRHQFERVLVVIEGLYSMDGDVPDLPRFIDIKHRHQAWLMVDEAHSFGVLGERGLGISEHFDVPASDVDIWMGTLSKSLAGCGGYIAGSQPLVETLRYLAPGFLYSVGIPAQVAAPSLTALQLMQQEPERLQQLHAVSQYFLEQARSMGLDTGHSIGAAVVPVIVGNSPLAAQLSQQLFEQGINVQPILHPAVPEKSARLRFFLSSEHSQTQIDTTLQVLGSLLT